MTHLEIVRSDYGCDLQLDSITERNNLDHLAIEGRMCWKRGTHLINGIKKITVRKPRKVN